MDYFRMQKELRKIISDLDLKFGSIFTVTLLRQPYHACDPARPNGWDCPAIDVCKDFVTIGQASWDFDDEKDEESEYDWGDQNNLSFEEIDHWRRSDPLDVEDCIVTLLEFA